MDNSTVSYQSIPINSNKSRTFSTLAMASDNGHGLGVSSCKHLVLMAN